MIFLVGFSKRMIPTVYRRKFYYDGTNRLLTRERPSSGCWRTKSVNSLKDASISQVISSRDYTYTGTGSNCLDGQQGHDTWYHYDQVGNVVAEINYTGAGLEVIDMEAFGKVHSGGTDGPRLTTKEQRPDIGLYYFGARWYDLGSGRWIEKDPMFMGNPHAAVFSSLVATAPQLRQPYGFNVNRPGMLVDTTGLLPSWLPPGGLAGSVIGGVVGGAWGCATSMLSGGSCGCGALGGAVSGAIGGALGGAAGGAIGGGLGGCTQGACQCILQGGGAGAVALSCLGSGAVGAGVGFGIGKIPGLPDLEQGATGTAGGTAAGGAAGAVASPKCGCGGGLNLYLN